MSETTEILFNSPALQSLRRDQLQKLCKLHSLKANGKNTELIERLKYHALKLPKDDPLSIAARSEESTIVVKPLNSSSDTFQYESDNQIPRPSDQWEIVMESIQEVEETAPSQGLHAPNHTTGTLHPPDEFGTGYSKTSTVSSSIRAFATSLGLKRASKSENSPKSFKASGEEQEDQPMDELTQYSIPYTATRPATPPLNDNFTFDPTAASHTRMSFAANGEPLPGCTLRPGEPAPADARLSLGLGLGALETATEQQPTTTIRLVSKSSSISIPQPTNFADAFQTPKLKPFATSFDLLMSPSGQNGGSGEAEFWAPDVHPEQFKNIYPTLTINDLPPNVPPSPTRTRHDIANATSTNAATNPGKEALLRIAASATATAPEPFIFGSPLPQHSVSNTQFRAAAVSVLEEMNKRLVDSGVEGVGMDLIGKLQPGTNKQTDIREVKPLSSLSGGKNGGEITKKFDSMHKVEFEKMEGIDGTLRRRGARISGQDKTSQCVAGKKRKSNVLGELGDGNGMPRRPMAKPTSFSADLGSIGGGRTSEATRVISNGRRAKVQPGAFSGEGDDETAASGQLGDEGQRRGGKRARVDTDAPGDGDAITSGNAEEKGKNENAMEVDNEDHEAEEEQKRKSKQLVREREVIKRKLELSRAKRRSSVGGAVVAATRSATVAASRDSRVAGVCPPVTPKPKTSRFGFLASAKKLVTSVWNRGKTAPMPAYSGASSKPTTTPARITGIDAPTKSSLLKRKSPETVPPKSVLTCTSIVSGTTNSRLTINQTQELKSSSGTARSKSPIPPAIEKPTAADDPMPSAETGLIAGGKRAGTNSSSDGGMSLNGTRHSSTSNAGIGSVGTKLQPRATSARLLAPTASSMAKMKRMDATPGSSAAPTTLSTVPPTALSGHKRAPLFGSIINSPKAQGIPRRGALLSPASSRQTPSSSSATPKQIFSKPVTVNGISGIPILKKADGEAGREGGDKDVMMIDAHANAENMPEKTALVRQRTITRKPRISRSKVIAKLASQRAAGLTPTSRRFANSPATPLARTSAATTLGTGTTPKTPKGLMGKRARSSIGARHVRNSFAGPGVLASNAGRGDKDSNVLASAKKRIRQSEYARRRSRISGLGGDE